MQRRKFLIGTGAAAVGAVNPTLAAPSIRPEQSLRRVVVTTDGEGSRVLADGAPTNAFELNGTKIMRLWETSAVPTSLPVDVDAGVTAGSAYREGFAGTSFYVAEIPPGVGRQQIPMHRNDTLDYMAILEGEIHLVLPDREILLQQGDTLIQVGVMHTWENRGDELCRLLFVVVPGQRDDR
jgi:mannose-6-phosphate isomerase-like protein (cupin superfamily)